MHAMRLPAWFMNLARLPDKLRSELRVSGTAEPEERYCRRRGPYLACSNLQASDGRRATGVAAAGGEVESISVQNSCADTAFNFI